MWFPIDDKAHSSDVFRDAKGLICPAGLYAMAGSWCMDHLTDGFVPAWFVAGWRGGNKAADWLVQHAAWIPVEAGFHFVNWPNFITRTEVEQRREKNRKRQQKYREEHRDDDTYRVT
jgi:hypothetical protein